MRYWSLVLCLPMLSIGPCPLTAAPQPKAVDEAVLNVDEKPTEPAVEKPGAGASAIGTIDTTEMKPLNPSKTVLLDVKKKRLVLNGEVVLSTGLLEMLICKARSKEHESIFSVDADAYVIHAGLLAIGAETGKPVRYEPKFAPPSGQIIDIFVSWTDKEGKPHRYKGQQLIRNAVHRYYGAALSKLPADFVMPAETELKYDQVNEELIWFGPMSKAQRDALLALSKDETYRKGIQNFFEDSQIRELDADWVFAGSGWYTHEDGTKTYLAEGGNLVCVANFGDAMLDLSVESSAENDGLMYEPYTERLPPLGTKVTIELIPRAKAKGAEIPKDAEEKPADPANSAAPSSPKSDSPE